MFPLRVVVHRLLRVACVTLWVPNVCPFLRAHLGTDAVILLVPPGEHIIWKISVMNMEDGLRSVVAYSQLLRLA